MGEVEIGLLIFALIIAVGFFANFIFKKTKFPDIIWLLMIGLLIGPIASIYGYDIISKQALTSIAPIFSAIALMMILFEGGLSMDIYKLVREAAPAFVLTVIGIIFSSLAVGGLFYLFSLWQDLGVGLVTSIILGIIVGGTSSAIVIPTVSGMKGIKKKPSLILSLESVLTDPFVIIIALVLMESLISQATYGTIFGDIFTSFSISIVLGIVAGLLWTKILPKLQQYEYHHMLSIAVIFIFYTLGELIGASGAIVAFMMGVIIGNSKKIMTMFKLKKNLGLTTETRRFNSLISFFIRTFFFVFIGTLVTFNNPMLFAVGVVLSFVLFGMRWVSLKILRNYLKLDSREHHLMLYMFPRGLAAAVLASSPMLARIPGTIIFNEIVFSIILTTIVISTFGVLTLDRKHPPGKVEKIEN